MIHIEVITHSFTFSASNPSTRIMITIRNKDYPRKIGTKTQWGKIQAISWRDGERFYMILNKQGVVSLMPADVVEDSLGD